MTPEGDNLTEDMAAIASHTHLIRGPHHSEVIYMILSTQWFCRILWWWTALMSPPWGRSMRNTWWSLWHSAGGPLDLSDGGSLFSWCSSSSSPSQLCGGPSCFSNEGSQILQVCLVGVTLGTLVVLANLALKNSRTTWLLIHKTRCSSLGPKQSRPE